MQNKRIRQKIAKYLTITHSDSFYFVLNVTWGSKEVFLTMLVVHPIFKVTVGAFYPSITAPQAATPTITFNIAFIIISRSDISPEAHTILNT